MAVKRILFLLFSSVFFLVGCSKVTEVDCNRLEGRYSFVDYRTPLSGAEQVLGGAFELRVSENGHVRMSGAWETEGEAVGTIVKLSPATVTKEDGTELHFEFGLVEGNRRSYMLKGRYTVSGVVPDIKTGALVEYHAKGWFDARK